MSATDNPQALMQQAAALRAAGRVEEAIAAYTRLLAQYPDLPNSWYNLGFLQRQAGSYDAALTAYAEALARGISEPEEVHVNRAVIYTDCLRREDEAERELKAALARNPDYEPALLNLGNLHEDRGNREDARRCYERILARRPNAGEALARYANLQTISGPDDPLARQLKRNVALPGMNAADKASLGFALGKLLDGSGAYSEAFAAYSQANAHSRNSAGPQGGHYDRVVQERFIDAIIATFTPERVRAMASAHTQVSGKAPLFVCGMFRSGSTLTEQILASHSRVTAGGELDLLPTITHERLSPYPAWFSNFDPAKLGEAANAYRSGLATRFPNADIVTDKRPDNFLYIGLVKALFPAAKIVHTTRHPLDNCLSIFFLHLSHAMPYAFDLADIGHYYAQYRRLMAHWKALYGADILDFEYDALVQMPEPAIKELLAFCGLEWEPACHDFHRVRNAVKTASVWQVREPLYSRASGRWRHYESQLASLRDDFIGRNILDS